ncbi:hypothetical protein DL96DRAFT_1712857 [Flagelloscypha sp. PMI_526]|nr:hypothetical protein DL96DRAFT_1712857 [Flagelloscypha sp. PMI_526]
MFATLLLAAALLPLNLVRADFKNLAVEAPGVPGDHGPVLEARSGLIEGLLGLSKRQYYCDAGYFHHTHVVTLDIIVMLLDVAEPIINRVEMDASRNLGIAVVMGIIVLAVTLVSLVAIAVALEAVGAVVEEVTMVNTTTIRSTSRTTQSTTFFSTNSVTFTSATATLPAPTRSPTGTSVSLTGPDIRWEGSWELTTSPCDTSKEAKSASGSGQPSTEYSMTYTIAKGASVQLSLDSSDNCKYTVTAGGVSESFTGPQKNSSQAGVNANCWFTYTASEKLSIGQQSWELSVKVEGPLTSGKRGLDERQSSTDWWLQVNQINILEDSSSASSTSLIGPSASSTSVSSGASNGGLTTMTSGSLWNLGLFAPLIGFFV